jgi:hypothetical protein
LCKERVSVIFIPCVCYAVNIGYAILSTEEEVIMNGERFRPPQGNPGNPQGPEPVTAAVPMRLDSYYSSIALLAISPREISVIFGRYVPRFMETGKRGAVPVFEREILMTVEQAEDLLRALGQAVEDFKKKKEEHQRRQEEARHNAVT